MNSSPLALSHDEAATTKIRPWCDTDLDQLIVIAQSTGPHSWSENDLRDSFDQAHLGYVLVVRHEICGYCIVRCLGSELELLDISIAHSRQSRGLGYALLRHVLADSKFTHVKEVWLEVRESNLRARSLYSRLGFTEQGMRKNYYPIKCESGEYGRENAIVMNFSRARL